MRRAHNNSDTVEAAFFRILPPPTPTATIQDDHFSFLFEISKTRLSSPELGIITLIPREGNRILRRCRRTGPFRRLRRDLVPRCRYNRLLRHNSFCIVVEVNEAIIVDREVSLRTLQWATNSVHGDHYLFNITLSHRIGRDIAFLGGTHQGHEDALVSSKSKL